MSDFEKTLKRLKDHFVVGTDKELREKISLTRSALDWYKKKGGFSEKKEYEICRENGLNREWLVTGKGEKYSTKENNDG